MNDKLIFTPRARKSCQNERPVIRITSDAMDKIEDISARTGDSISYIASRMISWAAEHTEVEYQEKE